DAARSFTGWSLDRDSGQFVFRRFVHDYGSKTVLGRSGYFDGDDVLDILLAKPQTAEFITRKLWREFVSPDVDEAEVMRIASRFRDSRYDIKVVQFDSNAWLAQLDRNERSRTDAATRLLLGCAPQGAADPTNAPLAMVRQIVLDAAYQLK